MNSWLLEFSERVSYVRYDEITVEIFLSNSLSAPIAVDAKLDTGSKFCIFQPRYAFLLGFNLESGARERIRTTAGSFTAYGHDVTLSVGDWQ